MKLQLHPSSPEVAIEGLLQTLNYSVSAEVPALTVRSTSMGIGAEEETSSSPLFLFYGKFQTTM